MKFGPVPIDEAEGVMLAHAATAGDRRLRKAHVLTSDDVKALKDAGILQVVAARLVPGDLGEDEAATGLAQAMTFSGIEAKPASTGRVNLYALASGVFVVDKAMIDAINAIDPAITVATLEEHAAVETGQMVATVKIIPFAVDAGPVDAAVAIVAAGEIFAVRQFRVLSVGLIQTTLPTVKTSVLDKTARVTRARLSRSGSAIVEELRPAHETSALATDIARLVPENDMVIVVGASALCDFDDVIPAAIRQAGGRVIRAGMPVDPGNLLVLGEVDGKPVLGAPGCARSPRDNGFDWVLDRLVAGLDVTDADIAGMGVGGLLMEIPTRPQPRELPQRAAPLDVHVVVLAAGKSSRMGGPNKLMALFSGQPLVRRTVEAAMASKANGTIVVTGHQVARIREALQGLDVKVAHNEDFANGLSGSIKAGIRALPDGCAGALVALGDMPDVTAADLDRLILAFRQSGGRAVVRATHGGKRGNPVLLPRELFGSVSQLEGDTGARHLIESGLLPVIDVEIGEGAGLDVDTPEALESAGGVAQG